MASFPGRPLDGPAAWRPADFAGSDPWLQRMPREILDLLDSDARRVGIAEEGLDPHPYFDAVRRELLDGRGFVLLRGIDPRGRSIEEMARLFWAVGARFGKPLAQNAKGHLLGHVKDLGYDAADPGVRLYQTHERQGYHTDSCDLVGLMCLGQARRGGLSSLASTWTAHNEMWRRDPDLARALFEPIATDQRGEPASWCSIPVFNWHAGRLIGFYQRKYIESAQRFPDAPRLTARQVKALDLFDQVLEEIALRMDFEPGDIQLVHNHQIFHDRTAFEDDPAKPRHLLRLWLAPEDGWAHVGPSGAGHFVKMFHNGIEYCLMAAYA